MNGMKMYKGKSDWNGSPWGDEKELWIVEFPNCISKTTGKPFKWMPSYDELNEIKKGLDEVEKGWKRKSIWEIDL